MMSANNQKSAPLTQASLRNTAECTNKDDSNFITVPKSPASESPQPLTPTSAKSNNLLEDPTSGNRAAPAVDRKEQKRRQNTTAGAAAEQAPNRHSSHASGAAKPSDSVPGDHDNVANYDIADPPLGAGSDVRTLLPLGAPSSDISRDKIWSTSNQEEHERIKEFWLSLGGDERKSLLKVEKDAILKKMKEQQGHTCNCTVCVRKRTAIEDKLEGLYDAYYLDLEQFANQGEGASILPPPRDFSLRPPQGLPSSHANQPPSRGRMVESIGNNKDEDKLEEVYSEDEVEDDDYSHDESPKKIHSSHDRDVTDFLTFGNSLQVKGGILAVADDLLKNDGKRFIEMMEQLAERRMAREEDAREHISRGYSHPSGSYSNPHSHPPPDKDEYNDEEDKEEDYEDSQEDEEYEDEEDPMTEEQRMQEARQSALHPPGLPPPREHPLQTPSLPWPLLRRKRKQMRPPTLGDKKNMTVPWK
ncbi:salt tolerance down-regulator-domain-containing protein [Thelonectria olida]|uniref:Stress response protein NST1 n=1 Tax=Thelonectria olida TaxID=1576542 RepID=A0A9P9AKE0_9HYPO|nr:salt tolerance down-regulator-domain-containing protein [Thelonectria olida]